MTGEALKALRLAYGLELPWFASLLGMTATKLSKWEQSEHISLHPLQAQTVALLELQHRVLGERATAFGRQILLGVMVYGPPYGLYLLLHKHFEGYAPEFTPPTRSNHAEPDSDV